MSIYCLGFITPFYTYYQSFLIANKKWWGPLPGKGSWQHLGGNIDKMLTTASGPLEALVLLPGRRCLPPGDPAHFSQVAAYVASSEDVQEGVASTRAPPSLSTPFNCLFLSAELTITWYTTYILLAYVACASLEWKPHGGRDLGWVMAVYLEKYVTLCRRSRDPLE